MRILGNEKEEDAEDVGGAVSCELREEENEEEMDCSSADHMSATMVPLFSTRYGAPSAIAMVQQQKRVTMPVIRLVLFIFL